MPALHGDLPRAHRGQLQPRRHARPAPAGRRCGGVRRAGGGGRRRRGEGGRPAAAGPGPGLVAAHARRPPRPGSPPRWSSAARPTCPSHGDTQPEPPRRPPPTPTDRDRVRRDPQPRPGAANRAAANARFGSRARWPATAPADTPRSLRSPPGSGRARPDPAADPGPQQQSSAPRRGPRRGATTSHPEDRRTDPPGRRRRPADLTGRRLPPVASRGSAPPGRSWSCRGCPRDGAATLPVVGRGSPVALTHDDRWRLPTRGRTCRVATPSATFEFNAVVGSPSPATSLVFTVSAGRWAPLDADGANNPATVQARLLSGTYLRAGSGRM